MSPVFSYLCKVASEKTRRDRALRAIDQARPYVQKGVGGAAGGLWFGANINKLRRTAEQSGPRRGVPLALAALGAALGLGDEKLRRLAREAKYKNVLKETRATT